MPRRSLFTLAAFSALLVLGAAAALAVTAPILKSSHNKTLKSTIVVDANGLTLYHLSSEKPGTTGCSGVCAKFWIPVLATKGKRVLGKGVIASKVGTVRRPDGKLQLTYNHYALYRYYLDKKPGQAIGEGFVTSTGRWYAIGTSGKLVKPKAPPPQSTTTDTTTTPGY
jgi:predicted lipoprotein with Yx(FWY)xxD motif